jgi:hypothetical protein
VTVKFISQNLIAVGMERTRNDPGSVIWDINRPGVKTQESPVSTIGGGLYQYIFKTALFLTPRTSRNDNLSFNITNNLGSEIVMEPSYELGASETTVALAWVPQSPHCLATGTSNKWLRIYDLRGFFLLLT